MRYLVVGRHGMLGRDLVDVLNGRDVSAPPPSELKIADLTAATAESPALVVHESTARFVQVSTDYVAGETLVHGFARAIAAEHGQGVLATG